jgi:hypothetical protein
MAGMTRRRRIQQPPDDWSGQRSGQREQHRQRCGQGAGPSEMSHRRRQEDAGDSRGGSDDKEIAEEQNAQQQPLFPVPRRSWTNPGYSSSSRRRARTDRSSSVVVSPRV